ncbi:MAG: CoA transferase [Chloroflexi bacterium]|nr:CoA transferase [Chloroflexota bacterium]
MSRPLAGVRVLDFTIAQQGPHSMMMLAQMGAEVIRVDRSGPGAPPPRTPARDHHMVGFSFAHALGKRSIAVDVRRPEGREIVLRLAATADVVTSNFRPGVMEKLGLGFDEMRAANPRIAYVTGSGWGRLGPYPQRSSLDMAAQAAGGMVWLSGYEDRPPQPASCAIADQVGALTLCTAALAALVRADRSGEAVQVDTSLYGGGTALQAWEMNASSLAGRTVRSGDGHTVLRPRGAVWRAFEASDGWLTVACEDAPTFTRLCDVAGAPDLAGSYPDDEARASHLEAIEARLAGAFAARSVEEWLRALRARDVPAGRVQSFAEVLADPQARANGYVGRTRHPDFGEIDVAGLPILFERDPVSPPPPPRPGADTDALLAEVGYSDDGIGQLRDDGVI